MAPHHFKGILLLLLGAFVLLCSTVVSLISFVQGLRVGTSRYFWRGYDEMGKDKGGILFLLIGFFPSLLLYLLLVIILFLNDLMHGRASLIPDFRNVSRSAASTGSNYELDNLTLWIAVVPFVLCVLGLLVVALL